MFNVNVVGLNCYFLVLFDWRTICSIINTSLSGHDSVFSILLVAEFIIDEDMRRKYMGDNFLVLCTSQECNWS